MNNELITTSVTRRTVVKTGAKLAYAVPLVAASFQLSGGALAEEWIWMDVLPFADAEAGIAANPNCKVIICHATCSDAGGNTKTGYSAIEIPGNCGEDPQLALEAHLLQHQKQCQDGRQDIFPLEVTDDKKKAKCPANGDIQSL
jgi:hypothetical protein